MRSKEDRDEKKTSDARSQAALNAMKAASEMNIPQPDPIEPPEDIEEDYGDEEEDD